MQPHGSLDGASTADPAVSQGRFFVADRSNYRVQILDQDLNLVDE